MPWFNVDDGFAFHQKAVRAGNAAIGLWTRAGSWCAQQLTDGYVPEGIAKTLGTASQIDRLVAAELWMKVAGGYQFHEWLDRQRSRSEVESDRKNNARKSALYRDPQLLTAVRKRDMDRCRFCGTLTNWQDRRGRAGATYDVVDPEAPNTLANLVVSCRRCNSLRNGRPLDECGMVLLEPGSMGDSQGAAGQSDAYQVRTSSEPDQNQFGTRSEQDPIPTTPLKEESLRDSPSEDEHANERTYSDDVHDLCRQLADWVVRNGSKKPTVGKRWREAARLMLDVDGRDPTKAAALIDWCQRDAFWRANIQSMSKFRDQYDTLRMRATAEWERSRTSNGNTPGRSPRMEKAVGFLAPDDPLRAQFESPETGRTGLLVIEGGMSA